MTENNRDCGWDREIHIEKEQGRHLGWKGLVLYYAGYTVLFCLMAAAVFCWFWFKRRRFVWQTDGVNQHYYGLICFSRWGKEVLRQFRETGVLRMPTFSLRMGYGEDLFTTLTYYVIGDPFSLPAVFVPERDLLVFHDLMLMVRFWLAGITFSAYSFYMGRRSRIGVLAGALIYIFNGFTLSGMRHHYFLNPFVFFPLLLLGCERYFRKKKPGLFIFMVFVTAVSNFYFFYMLVIMTVLYAVWRSVRLHGLRRFGRVILDGIAFAFYGIVGTLLASFIFLPVVLRFLQDPRTGAHKVIPYVWTESFYRNFLDCFLSNGTTALSDSWTYMGFGAAALFCVFFIFVQRRRHRDLKAAFIGLTLLLLTPAAGYVLNGFSYPANRWMWAYALLTGFMAATALPEIAGAGVRQLAAAMIVFAAAVAVCVGWKYTFSRASAQAVMLALAGIAAVLLERAALLERLQGMSGDGAGTGREAEKAREKACEEMAVRSGIGREPEEAGEKACEKACGKTCVETAVRAGRRAAAEKDLRRKASVRAQAALLVCVMLTIASEAYFAYSPQRSAKVLEYLSRAQIETQTAKDAAAARQLIDEGLLLRDQTLQENTEQGGRPFYRYTAYNPENNTNILYGVSNTQYYWSLSNPGVSQFLDETGQLNSMIHLYDTLDDRTFLNAVAGIRYFLGNDAEGLPFGYEKKEGCSYSNAGLWPEMDKLDRYSCELYENTCALPFGFTTDRWISRADYEAMDIPQRQEALMQGIVLDQDPGENFVRLQTAGGGDPAEAGLTFTDRRLPVSVEFDPARISAEGLPEGAAGKTAAADEVPEGATGKTAAAADEVPEGAAGKTAAAAEALTGCSFTVQEGGAPVTLRFSGMRDCETYLYIRGMQYRPAAGMRGPDRLLVPVTGYVGEEEAASKQIGFTTPENPWTTGRKDFLVNLRYHSAPLDRIEMVFPAEGTFSFDSIEVVGQPMDTYPAQAQVLCAEGMTDLDIHEMGDSFATDRITGQVELTSPQILCLQIPRTAGWTAWVDGRKADLLRADTMFSALLLPEGSHSIELRYQTPGLRLGAAISAGMLVLMLVFGLLYTIVFWILQHREKRLAAVPAGTWTEVSGGVPADGTEKEAALEVPAEDTGKEAASEAPAEDTEKEAASEAPVEDTGKETASETPADGRPKAEKNAARPAEDAET